MPAAVQNDAAVNQNVIEEEESLCLLLPATLLLQTTLSHQDAPRLEQRLPPRGERALHGMDPLPVLLVKGQLVHSDVLSEV